MLLILACMNPVFAALEIIDKSPDNLMRKLEMGRGAKWVHSVCFSVKQ